MNFEAQIPSASDLVKTNLVIYFERRPIFALESCFHFSHFLNWWRSQQERRLRTQETNKAEFAENGDPEFQERHLRGGITITTSTLQRGAEFCPTKLNRNILNACSEENEFCGIPCDKNRCFYFFEAWHWWSGDVKIFFQSVFILALQANWE